MDAKLISRNGLNKYYFLFFLFCSINYSSLASAIAPAIDPLCYTVPDPYELGTGINHSGLCIAANSAASVVAAVEASAKQDISLLKQGEQIAQEVLTVQNLVIQTEQLMKDIEENPLQVIVPDVDQIIRNQQRINQLAQNIDKNSSKVGDNLIKDLYHPETIGLGNGSKFELWSQARAAAVHETYGTVQSFLKDLKSENTSFDQAIKNIRGAHGQRQAAKSVGEIAGDQLTMMAKIRDLLMNLLNLQAADQGARLQAESDAAVSQKAIMQNGLGPKFTVPNDVFIGPGSANSQPF